MHGYPSQFTLLASIGLCPNYLITKSNMERWDPMQCIGIFDLSWGYHVYFESDPQATAAPVPVVPVVWVLLGRTI